MPIISFNSVCHLSSLAPSYKTFLNICILLLLKDRLKSTSNTSSILLSAVLVVKTVMEKLIIDLRQYLFEFNDQQYYGVFHFIGGNDTSGETNINIEILEITVLPDEEIICPVMLEVESLSLTNEWLIANVKDINVLENNFVIDKNYFKEHLVPYRSGISNIFCIDNPRFIVHKFSEELDSYQYINNEYSYLCSRVAITEVNK